MTDENLSPYKQNMKTIMEIGKNLTSFFFKSFIVQFTI